MQGIQYIAILETVKALKWEITNGKFDKMENITTIAESVKRQVKNTVK